MKHSRILIRLRMLNAKLRAYGFDEGLTGDSDMPSIDSKFNTSLLAYTKSVEQSIVHARNFLSEALLRDYGVLAGNLEEDITRLEKLLEELRETQYSVADMELTSISMTADALHKARRESKPESKFTPKKGGKHGC